jgi:hypothetical protein
MVFELEFSAIDGVVAALEAAADLPGVVSCEVETDALLVRLTMRCPLEGASRATLDEIRGLLRVRSWPSPPPLFRLPRSPEPIQGP